MVLDKEIAKIRSILKDAYNRGYRAGRKSDAPYDFNAGKRQGRVDARYDITCYLSGDPAKRKCKWLGKLIAESGYKLVKDT